MTLMQAFNKNKVRLSALDAEMVGGGPGFVVFKDDRYWAKVILTGNPKLRAGIVTCLFAYEIPCEPIPFKMSWYERAS